MLARERPVLCPDEGPNVTAGKRRTHREAGETGSPEHRTLERSRTG